MTEEEGSSGESVYSFSCSSDGSQATTRLLEISDKCTLNPDSWTVEAFLESLDRPDQFDREEQKKTRNTATDIGSSYAFAHFEDTSKYMQRYRYFHTVGDTGRCNTSPRALRIELDTVYSDYSYSTRSIKTAISTHYCTKEFRTLLMNSRPSISEMSTIKRNYSAPCSKNLKSAKRVYLTWEQYVEMCESDVSSQNQFQQTGSSLVSFEAGQKTPTDELRKVSSAVPPRKPCIDLHSIVFRNDDITTGYRYSFKDAKRLVCAKSELCLSDSQRKNTRNTSKPFEKSNNSFRTLGTVRDSTQTMKTCTEGGKKSRLSNQQLLLPDNYPEKRLSKVSGEKITLKRQPAKTSTDRRCRNISVYKYTKSTRKQIHL